jgi:hypothetical protein
MKLVVVTLVTLVTLVLVGAALAGHGDPRERFTAADQARAKAMVLRPGDLNAAYVAHPASSGGSGFYCAALDESDLTLTGRSNSPSFTATGEYISSTASVYATRSDSNASWTRGTSPAGEKCVRAGLRAALQGGVVRLVSFKRVAFPKRGTRSVAYRAVATFQGVRVFIDFVAMQVVRAQISVVYVNALAPPPQSEVRRLTGAVATRAQKAMRGA